ncbi:hypothetical protein EYD10_03785 [Varanus komodoensis]|nr:hypothetical protein EYD10_03785 [Varanus komodoensis]
MQSEVHRGQWMEYPDDLCMTILRPNQIHHFYFLPFREQPIYSTRAHVFQIDPNTKKNWVPTSKHAVTVSYFYDSTRNVYRIISLDGSKAIINSTITPNMTFTKTSQKFGQWADSRANTVYGLGFSSEHHLSKFAEKFQEFKEAARLAKEKSQEKMELTSTPSQESAGEIQSPLTPESINGTDDERTTPEVTQNSEPRAEPTQNALPFAHRLKRPSSLSLTSYGIPCKPATNLVALRCTDSILAISFL